MTEALKKNKVQFVELILRQGIVMKEYLTVQVMVELYENVGDTACLLYTCIVYLPLQGAFNL